MRHKWCRWYSLLRAIGLVSPSALNAASARSHVNFNFSESCAKELMQDAKRTFQAQMAAWQANWHEDSPA